MGYLQRSAKKTFRQCLGSVALFWGAPSLCLERDLAHLTEAALFAIALRSSAGIAAARARPPFFPPSRPNATAAGFLTLSDSGSGSPFNCSPMVCSTTRFATAVKSLSLLERVGMVGLSH